jgi:hypothetical protein
MSAKQKDSDSTLADKPKVLMPLKKSTAEKCRNEAEENSIEHVPNSMKETLHEVSEKGKFALPKKTSSFPISTEKTAEAVEASQEVKSEQQGKFALPKKTSSFPISTEKKPKDEKSPEQPANPSPTKINATQDKTIESTPKPIYQLPKKYNIEKSPESNSAETPKKPDIPQSRPSDPVIKPAFQIQKKIVEDKSVPELKSEATLQLHIQKQSTVDSIKKAETENESRGQFPKYAEVKKSADTGTEAIKKSSDTNRIKTEAIEKSTFTNEIKTEAIVKSPVTNEIKSQTTGKSAGTNEIQTDATKKSLEPSLDTMPPWKRELEERKRRK